MCALSRLLSLLFNLSRLIAASYASYVLVVVGATVVMIVVTSIAIEKGVVRYVSVQYKFIVLLHRVARVEGF